MNMIAGWSQFHFWLEEYSWNALKFKNSKGTQNALYTVDSKDRKTLGVVKPKAKKVGVT